MAQKSLPKWIVIISDLISGEYYGRNNKRKQLRSNNLKGIALSGTFKSNYKVYACIVAFLFLWLVIAPFEFREFRLSRILHPLLWIATGIAGVWLLQNKQYKQIRVKLIILFGLYLLLTCWFLFSSIFCSLGKGSVVYVNKKNRSNIIICRPYACFLTSDDCEYFISWSITGNLRWTRKLSGSRFDTAKWERFKDSAKNKY